MAKKKTGTIEKQEEVKEVKTKVKATKEVATKRNFSEATPMMVAELKKEYMETRMKLMSGKETNTGKLKLLRKDIARAMTHLNLKSNNNEQN